MTYTAADLCAYLSHVVGRERALILVTETALQLSLVADQLDGPAALRVLDAIGRRPGIEGMAARLAGVRLRAQGVADEPETSADRRPLHVLEGLLSPTLGSARAHETVRECARQAGIERDEISLDEALAILESVATRAGSVGVSGRFAKSRLLLIW